MDLRQRVEDRAGGLVELNRAADLERAMQRFFGARQVAKPHADLSERGERDREPVAGAVRLVKRHAALGERQRLLVAVLEHQHVGLVAADRRQHVVGLHERREPLGLPQRGHRLVVSAELRQRDARQRVHEREVPPIAGGVQRRGRFGDVLADDRGVADLAVALAELVVGEADGARVVRGLGVLQRAAVERDGARLIAARRGEAAVQPPERRQPAGGNRVAEGVGRPAERRRRLIEVVLQQPRLGERRADGELVFARQRRRAQRGRQQLRGFGAAAAFERGAGAREKRLQGGDGTVGSIQGIQVVPRCESAGFERRWTSAQLSSCCAVFPKRFALGSARRASSRAEQSQSPQAQGSVPLGRGSGCARARPALSRGRNTLPSTRALRRAASGRSRPRPTARVRSSSVRAFVHVAEVLAAGDRTPRRACRRRWRRAQRCFLAVLDASRHQIAHGSLLIFADADAPSSVYGACLGATCRTISRSASMRGSPGRLASVPTAGVRIGADC